MERLRQEDNNGKQRVERCAQQCDCTAAGRWARAWIPIPIRDGPVGIRTHHTSHGPWPVQGEGRGEEHRWSAGPGPGLVTRSPKAGHPLCWAPGRSLAWFSLMNQKTGCLSVQEAQTRTRREKPGGQGMPAGRTPSSGRSLHPWPPASTHLQGEPLELHFQSLLVFFQTTALPFQLLNLQPARRAGPSGHIPQPTHPFR